MGLVAAAGWGRRGETISSDSGLTLSAKKETKLAKRKMVVVGELLTSQGYCRISKTKKIVARIDQKDWIEILAKQLGKPVAELTADIKANPGVYEDLYRRELSQDQLYVGLVTFRTVPSSQGCPVRYIEKENDLIPPGTSRTPLPEKGADPPPVAKAAPPPVVARKQRRIYRPDDLKPQQQPPFYRDHSRKSWIVRTGYRKETFSDNDFQDGYGNQPASWWSYIEALNCRREAELKIAGKSNLPTTSDRLAALYLEMINRKEEC
jgi:hypothetical protein